MINTMKGGIYKPMELATRMQQPELDVELSSHLKLYHTGLVEVENRELVNPPLQHRADHIQWPPIRPLDCPVRPARC
jgi:hypothetical protein